MSFLLFVGMMTSLSGVISFGYGLAIAGSVLLSSHHQLRWQHLDMAAFGLFLIVVGVLTMTLG